MEVTGHRGCSPAWMKDRQPGLFDGLHETARDELVAQFGPVCCRPTRCCPGGGPRRQPVPCRRHVLSARRRHRSAARAATGGRRRGGGGVAHGRAAFGDTRRGGAQRRVGLSQEVFLALAARRPVLLANLARIVAPPARRTPTAAPAQIAALLHRSRLAGQVQRPRLQRPGRHAAPLTVLDATGAEADPVQGRPPPVAGSPGAATAGPARRRGRRRVGTPACAHRPRRPRGDTGLLRPHGGRVARGPYT